MGQTKSKGGHGFKEKNIKAKAEYDRGLRVITTAQF